MSPASPWPPTGRSPSRPASGSRRSRQAVAAQGPVHGRGCEGHERRQARLWARRHPVPRDGTPQSSRVPGRIRRHPDPGRGYRREHRGVGGGDRTGREYRIGRVGEIAVDGQGRLLIGDESIGAVKRVDRTGRCRPSRAVAMWTREPARARKRPTSSSTLVRSAWKPTTRTGSTSAAGPTARSSASRKRIGELHRVGWAVDGARQAGHRDRVPLPAPARHDPGRRPAVLLESGSLLWQIAAYVQLRGLGHARSGWPF